MAGIIRKALERLAFAYARISDDDGQAAESTDYQHVGNAETATDEDVTILQTFTDDGVSAFSGKERKGYLAMLARIEAGEIDGGFVLARAADRIHRNLDDANHFAAVCKRHRITVITGLDGQFRLWTSTGKHAFVNAINTAEHESGRKAERVAESRQRRQTKGLYGGSSRRPFGWGAWTTEPQQRYDVKKGEWVPKAATMIDESGVSWWRVMERHNETEAVEIRRWAHDLLRGGSLMSLLDDINKRGVPTVMGGGKWTARAVKQILMSPRTSGHAVYSPKGEDHVRGDAAIVARDVLPAILSDDDRRELVELFEGRKNRNGNGVRHLLSLIARCGHPECADDPEAYMRMASKHGHPTYICNSRGNTGRRAEELDDNVTALVLERLSREDAVDLLNVPDVGAEQAALKAEADAIRRKLSRLLDLYEEDEIGKVEYLKRKRDREGELKRVEDRRKALGTPRTPVDDAPLGSVDVEAWWSGLHIRRQRAVVAFLLDIVVLPLGGGRPKPVLPGQDYFEARKVIVTRKKQTSE